MKLKSSQPRLDGAGLRVGIVLPRFNDSLGLKLYENVVKELVTLGVSEVDIEMFRVPGTLELPFAVHRLVMSRQFDVFIALGVVIEGETKHFDLVITESHRGLMDVSIRLDFPVIFGILVVANEHQAKERINSSKMNKGKDFARSAIEMACFHRNHS